MLDKKEGDKRDRIATRYERKVLSAFLAKETRADRLAHYYFRSLWVRTFDFGTDVRRKMARVARTWTLGKVKK